MKLSTVCLSIALAITLTAVKPLAAHHSDEDSFGTRSLLRPSHAFLSSSAAAIQWCRHCGGGSAAVAGRPCEPRIDGRPKRLLGSASRPQRFAAGCRRSVPAVGESAVSIPNLQDGFDTALLPTAGTERRQPAANR